MVGTVSAYFGCERVIGPVIFDPKWRDFKSSSRPLQRLGFILRRAHPNIAFFICRVVRITSVALGWIGWTTAFGEVGQKAINEMRAGDRFDLVPRSPRYSVQMPAKAKGGRSSLSANQTTLFCRSQDSASAHIRKSCSPGPSTWTQALALMPGGILFFPPVSTASREVIQITYRTSHATMFAVSNSQGGDYEQGSEYPFAVGRLALISRFCDSCLKSGSMIVSTI
jgi:hypothetical protein